MEGGGWGQWGLKVFCVRARDRVCVKCKVPSLVRPPYHFKRNIVIHSRALTYHGLQLSFGSGFRVWSRVRGMRKWQRSNMRKQTYEFLFLPLHPSQTTPTGLTNTGAAMLALENAQCGLQVGCNSSTNGIMGDSGLGGV